MMKKISAIILLVVIYACSKSNKKLSNGIDRIPVEMHKVTQDASSFLEKIELVPLETEIRRYFLDVIKSFMIKVQIYLQFIPVIK